MLQGVRAGARYHRPDPRGGVRRARSRAGCGSGGAAASWRSRRPTATF